VVVEVLLAVGAIATGLCFVRGDRRIGAVGVLVGVGAFLVYIVVGSMVESVAPGLLVAGAYAAVMSVAAARSGAPETAPGQARPSSQARARRAVLGALIGTVPGALVMVVPLLLHSLGVITSDQSQVGFLGLFFLPIGLVAGGVIGAATADGSTPERTSS
jgi:cobalamin synthase